jgi:hypothetical protein
LRKQRVIERIQGCKGNRALYREERAMRGQMAVKVVEGCRGDIGP